MGNPTRAQAIKRILDARTQPDLAATYHAGMEVQVNVAQDDGQRRTDGYTGRGKGRSYTDGAQSWADFRVPKNAWAEPEDNSGIVMTWSLADHADAIGMTGWCYSERRSYWVAFDFDAIVGHSERHVKKLSDEELARVRDAAHRIPWVEVRRSTSGNGLHLYVRFAMPVPTANHTEHAALGQAVLAEMSALVGFDFRAKVDAAGGNMWVWARKMPKGPDGTQRTGIGLQLIQAARHPMPEAPKGWERYVGKAKGERKKSLPKFAEGASETFEETSGQQPRIELDEEHRKLIAWLQENQGWGWWDADHHMLVTHTHHLKRYAQHREATGSPLKGRFDTISPGTQVDEQNVFAFPVRAGGWSVRRYSRGAAEHESWTQDGKGWTRCWFNRDPDLRSAAVAIGGIETAEGAYQFKVAEDVTKVVKLLGGSIDVPHLVSARPAKVTPHKEGKRLVVEVDHVAHDRPDDMKGWYLDKGKRWRIVVAANVELKRDDEVGTFDELIRHAVTESRVDAGWYVKVEEKWNCEPKQNVSLALQSVGKKRIEADLLMGASVLKPWTLVDRPFEDEYPGDRTWNHSKVRYLYPRSEEVGEFPHWRMVFEHAYSGLDEALAVNGWALANDVRHGWEWGEAWWAALLQDPYQPLPYVFFWSKEEDTGKSIVHEAARLLISEEGIVEAAKVVEGKDSFNGQLESAVLCYIEELDLQKNKGAYERIKNLVTSPRISIRRLYMDAYQAANKTHWIHCANKHQACPIFPGDTRITMVHVPPLPPGRMIPKPVLMERLKSEAPHFLNHLLSIDVPPSGSRLRVPVIDTSEKHVVSQGSRDALQAFIDDNCYLVPGEMIAFSEFHERFKAQLDPDELSEWTSKGAIRAGLPPGCPVGKRGPDSYIGNVSWEPAAKDAPPKRKLVLDGRQLHSTPEIVGRAMVQQAQVATVSVATDARTCGAKRAGWVCTRVLPHGPPHVADDGIEWAD